MSLVSLIIPVLNEERYLKSCLDTVLNQTYPAELTEIILIDGGSQDKSLEIIQEYQDKYKDIVLLHNKRALTPISINLGIKAAQGDFIIRLDAHSLYPPNYVEDLIKTSQDTKADNVGGLAIAQGGEDKFSQAVAYLISSKLANGSSDFRNESESRYVDTVPFGCFPKELFDQIGYYDERLARNEDNEFNYRIKEQGGKIYLNSNVRVDYFARRTWSSLVKMAFSNGLWSVFCLRLHPKSMSIKYFVPLAFVVSLLLFLIQFLLLDAQLINYLFYFEFALYLFLVFAESTRIAFKQGFSYFFYLLILFPSFHIAYGLGSLIALFRRVAK